jgi:hypothetical protein
VGNVNTLKTNCSHAYTNEIGEKSKVFGIPIAFMKSLEIHPSDRGSDRFLQGETAGKY